MHCDNGRQGQSGLHVYKLGASDVIAALTFPILLSTVRCPPSPVRPARYRIYIHLSMNLSEIATPRLTSQQTYEKLCCWSTSGRAVVLLRECSHGPLLAQVPASRPSNDCKILRKIMEIIESVALDRGMEPNHPAPTIRGSQADEGVNLSGRYEFGNHGLGWQSASVAPLSVLARSTSYSSSRGGTIE
ncbi:hypothetical protein J6590_048593 [Homalodisca vitripennis]|nr:hypothetical protein J6590_048593 [Homalodisca vitripennis]